jgi:hypothetical protein
MEGKRMTHHTDLLCASFAFRFHSVVISSAFISSATAAFSA